MFSKDLENVLNRHPKLKYTLTKKLPLFIKEGILIALYELRLFIKLKGLQLFVDKHFGTHSPLYVRKHYYPMLKKCQYMQPILKFPKPKNLHFYTKKGAYLHIPEIESLIKHPKRNQFFEELNRYISNLKRNIAKAIGRQYNIYPKLVVDIATQASPSLQIRHGLFRGEISILPSKINEKHWFSYIVNNVPLYSKHLDYLFKKCIKKI